MPFSPTNKFRLASASPRAALRTVSGLLLTLFLAQAAVAQDAPGLPANPVIDLAIQGEGDANFTGDGVYGQDGGNESLQRQVAPGQTVIFTVKLKPLILTAPIPVKLEGPAGRDGWTIAYFGALSSSADLTSAITTPGGAALTLTGSEVAVRVAVTPPPDLKQPASMPLTLKAYIPNPAGQAVVADAVQALITATPPDKSTTGVKLGWELVDKADMSTTSPAEVTVSYNDPIELKVDLTNTGTEPARFLLTAPAPADGTTTVLLDAITDGQPVGASGFKTPTIDPGGTVSTGLTVTVTHDDDHQPVARTCQAPLAVTLAGQLRRRDGDPLGPPETLNIPIHLQLLHGLQWSYDNVVWHDATDKPIPVQQNGTIGFRAVLANTSAGWPETSPVKPVWSRDSAANTKTPGNQVAYEFDYLRRSAVPDEVVTASCGNSLSVAVHVVPNDNG